MFHCAICTTMLSLQDEQEEYFDFLPGSQEANFAHWDVSSLVMWQLRVHGIPWGMLLHYLWHHKLKC